MKLTATIIRSVEAGIQAECATSSAAGDPRYLGLWLTGLSGNPDTTDNHDGSWDHEFASGSDDLPSYTVGVGMAKVPAFSPRRGKRRLDSRLESPDPGPAAATINAIAQGGLDHAQLRPRWGTRWHRSRGR